MCGVACLSLKILRNLGASFVARSGFDSAVGIVIIANAVTIGLETHYALQIPSGCALDGMKRVAGSCSPPANADGANDPVDLVSLVA